MKKSAILLCSTLLLIGCQRQTEQNVVENFNPFDESQWKLAQEIKADNIDLDMENEREMDMYKFSDLFSKVEYVKLDTVPEALFGEMDKLIVTEKGEYIIFDRGNALILHFAADGKFLNKIGAKGHAKQEYLWPGTVQYDEKSQKVFVSDATGHLKEYALDGTFLKDIDIQCHLSQFGIIDDQHFATFGYYYQESGEVDHHIKIYDFEGNLQAQYVPYQAEPTMIPFVSLDSYVNVGCHLLCNEYDTPLIYTFEGTTPKPLYYINFGKMTVPGDLALNRNIKDHSSTRDWFRSHDFYNIGRFFDNPRHLIVTLSKIVGNEGYELLLIHDKEHPNHTQIKFMGINDLGGLISTHQLMFAQDDKLYFPHEPSIIEDFLSRLDQAPEYQGRIKDADITLRNELAANNNHILQICTLK